MTPSQIEEVFFHAIQEKAIYKKIENVTEDMIYNWRKGRGKKPSIGDMLNVIYQLNLVEVKPKE